MKSYQRDACRYTPLFCEENIWWLAHDLVAEGIDADRLQVLLFSNPWQSVLMFNQRQAQPGEPAAWDYHVVLHAELDGRTWIFDLDTRLPFPTPCSDYLADSFPAQESLPVRFRSQVRVIPAASYLAHFYSDRSHMVGRIPQSAFPDYPIIQPAPDTQAIALADYRDMHKQLTDGSTVLAVDALRRRVAETPAP